MTRCIGFWRISRELLEIPAARRTRRPRVVRTRAAAEGSLQASSTCGSPLNTRAVPRVASRPRP